MHRTWLVGLSLGLGAGCFSPNEMIDIGTDGNGSDTEPSTLTSSGAGTDGPSSGGTTDSSGTSTLDPTENPSTTVDPTEGETESATATDTGIGDPCDSPDDCASGVCFETECVPCGDTPDPDVACSDSDSATPFCSADGSSCVACTASSCDGSTPACDPEAGCVACDEHSQCPDSACHLGGPDTGSCFDVADVVEVSDTAEFDAALDSITSGSQRAIHLLAGEYSTLIAVDLGEEVALIGEPGTTLTGGATNLIYHNGGRLYLHRLEIDTGPNRAIAVASDAAIWIDDVTVANYNTALNVFGGSAIVRRSQFRGTQFEGGLVVINEGASLVATNSGFGPQGNPALSTAGELDLRYVTIAGNTQGVECFPQASGQIRNSILVNPGTTNVGCGGNLNYIDNASDAFSFGEDVGAYDTAWFTISSGSTFFLSASGQAVFEDIADWDEGDPLVDIEGDPRPTKVRGYPGVDEP